MKTALQLIAGINTAFYIAGIYLWWLGSKHLPTLMLGIGLIISAFVLMPLFLYWRYEQKRQRGAWKREVEKLTPLRLQPIYKDKIWGGDKIRTILGKDFGTLPNCGESWEISGVRGDVSTVAEGPLQGMTLTGLIEKYKGMLLGEKIYRRFGTEFPLLVKFIDANDELSIQVHPDDTLAMLRHDSCGKTEMWYVLAAEPGASLVSGFNRPLDKQTYLEYFNSGRLEEILNKVPVQSGDSFFLPAGRVHSIGRGLLIAEIQQSSDVTYRIYDFERTDQKGHKRELHVEQALAAIDYTHCPQAKIVPKPVAEGCKKLAGCEYFSANLLTSDRTLDCDYSDLDSFVILIGVEGSFTLHWDKGSTTVRQGESILVPARLKNIRIEPAQGSFKALETYVK